MRRSAPNWGTRVPGCCFRSFHRFTIPAAVALLVGTPAASLAAQTSDNTITVPSAVPPPLLAVPAQSGAPVIDGRLDDVVWRTAPIITGFYQRDPDEGEPASEPTEVQVVYTDDALFVGVKAYEEHLDQLAGHLTRRDEWSPSDWIGVAVDSYHDRRTAFFFAVNPAGVKLDRYLFDDSNEDDSWDAVWDVATARDGEGWTAEFRIPFSQLRFSSAEHQVFGFNVYRRINHRAEEQYLRVPPKDQAGVVSHFGDLVGIEGIEPPRRIEVMPYASGSSTWEPEVDGDPFRTGTDQAGRVGADLNVGVTSNLTLSATVNPDFGQVEADPAVVNLSAFETFFPEKRPFFNEGLDMFRFSLGSFGNGSEQLFYSRRIGRAPQGDADPRGGYAETVAQTTILGAAKLSGKTRSGWTMGLLGALTAEEEADVIDASGTAFRDVVEPRSTYFVGRLARDFRNGLTQVGLFGTAVNRALPDNLRDLRSAAYTAGLNWTHRFADEQFTLNGFLVGSRVEGSAEAIDRTQRSSTHYYQRPDSDYLDYDPTRTSLSGFAFDVSGGKVAGNWRYQGGYSTRSPGFEVNDAGFQQESDYHIQWIWVNRRWLQPGKVFRRFNVNLNQWSAWNYGWDRVTSGGNVNVNFQLLNYWDAFAGIGRQLGGLQAAPLRGGPGFLTPSRLNFWSGLFTDDRKAVRGGINVWGGREDESGSWNWGAFAELAWRAATNVDLSFAPTLRRQFDSWQYLRQTEALGETHYLFGELSQTTLSTTFRGSMTFAPTLSLQLYAEPFISSGDYQGYRRVAEPRGATFADRFDDFGPDRVSEADGSVAIDLDGSGTTDVSFGNPDFTFLSFRSNVVLRWEYMLGSTLFLVWQHGRTGFDDRGSFDFRDGIDRLFSAPASNTLVVKVNYWLSM